MNDTPEPVEPVARTLQLRGIHKTYPGVNALRGVDLDAVAGRVLLLLGANGAGKSTLMNVLAGVVQPDSGDILLDGQPMRFDSVHAAQHAGIAAVFQELSLAPNLTVAENICLGREPRTRLGLLDRATMREQARRLLQRLGVEVSPDDIVGTLRVGQQQIVEIARALSVGARVLIFDEPTSALSQQESQVLLQSITDLKAQGAAIVYITHKFEELNVIGDDVVIMRDGEVVARSLLRDITREQIVQHLTGAAGGSPAVARGGRVPGDSLLRVRGATLSAPSRGGRAVLQDIGFDLCRGEVLGIFGLKGAGRTELLELIVGRHSGRQSISVEVDGRSVAMSSPSAARRAGIALAPEDRKLDGLVLGMNARENAGLACQSMTSRFGWLLQRARERSLLDPIFRRFGVPDGSRDRAVGTLSGGNQQKVILAKWLSAGLRILLLDEPTRGIDVHARQEIYQLIHQVAADGLGVVVVSSDLDEILALADRVMVLCEGRVTGEFARSTATADLLMEAAMPKAMRENAA